MKNRKRISSIFQIGVVGALLSTAFAGNAQVDGYSASGDAQLTKVSNLAKAPQPRFGQTRADSLVDFSSDGKWKVYLDDQGVIYSEHINGDTKIALSTILDDVRGFVIAPNSTIMYFSDQMVAIGGAGN